MRRHGEHAAPASRAEMPGGRGGDGGASRAFAKAADGQATKIIIPSEIQGLAGMVKAVTEVAKEG